MARIFYAARLPAKLTERLREETERLQRSDAHVLWVSPANYHITLRFVGEVQDRDLMDVLRAGDRALAGLQKIPLVAVGLDTLPDRERPRVVICGVRGVDDAAEARFQELRTKLDTELQVAGWVAEREARHAHITLGRVRGDKGAALLGERVGPAVRREFGHFSLNEVVLLETFDGRDGLSYTPLRTFLAR